MDILAEELGEELVLAVAPRRWQSIDADTLREHLAERLAAAQRRFLELRLELGGQTTDGKLGPGLLVVMEGSDAGGKGGAVRRITAALDARNYQVIPIAAPTDEEKAHHYLWRFWRHVPRSGRVTVYDRSWYGRVLVERVVGCVADRARPARLRRSRHAYWRRQPRHPVHGHGRRQLRVLRRTRQ